MHFVVPRLCPHFVLASSALVAHFLPHPALASFAGLVRLGSHPHLAAPPALAAPLDLPGLAALPALAALAPVLSVSATPNHGYAWHPCVLVQVPTPSRKYQAPPQTGSSAPWHSPLYTLAPLALLPATNAPPARNCQCYSRRQPSRYCLQIFWQPHPPCLAQIVPRPVDPGVATDHPRSRPWPAVGLAACYWQAPWPA